MPIKSTGEIAPLFDIEIDNEDALHPDFEDTQLDLEDFFSNTNDPSSKFANPNDNEATPALSKKSVKKAGRALRRREGNLKDATEKIQFYRALHEPALETIAGLISRCCKHNQLRYITMATRLKRLDTIVNKLQRKSWDGETDNKTCVSRMQDIAGCRFIFEDLQALELVFGQLQTLNLPESRVKIRTIDDYVNSPKSHDCGYRSIHLVYEYLDSNGAKYLVEAQLRTRLQHLWATAVEIVDVIANTNIKTHSHSIADKSNEQKQWEALLEIMSAYLAAVEGAGIALDHANIVKLNQLSDELNAVSRLEHFSLITDICREHEGKSGFIVLLVDLAQQRSLFDEVFYDESRAVEIFNSVEKICANFDRVNALLVSTKDIGQMQNAYPNYLGDCHEFIELLKAACTSGN